MNTKDVTLCGMFSALIAIGAFLKIDIPLPIYTMHFTLQWLFVLIAALLLGSTRGFFSVAAYLVMGLVGLPIFAAGGGPSYVFRAGFGFLLGFAVAAYVMGKLTEKSGAYDLKHLIPITALGLVIYYAVGAVYFYLIKNVYAGTPIAFGVVVVQYCLVTVLPDFILCVLACILCIRLRPNIRQFLQ